MLNREKFPQANQTACGNFLLIEQEKAFFVCLHYTFHI